MDISIILIGKECSTIESLCKKYSTDRDSLLNDIFLQFEKFLAVEPLPEGSVSEKIDTMLLNCGKIRIWLDKCQEMTAELQFQLNSLVGVQRLLLIRREANPAAIPVALISEGVVVEKCRIFDGIGMNLIADLILGMSSEALSEVKKQYFVFHIGDSLEKSINLHFEGESPDEVCVRWLRTVISYFSQGIASCKHSTIGEDIAVLRETGAEFLKSLLEFHINLERFIGKIESIGKEIGEANSQKPFLEE